jgi:hypothetical protein
LYGKGREKRFFMGWDDHIVNMLGVMKEGSGRERKKVLVGWWSYGVWWWWWWLKKKKERMVKSERVEWTLIEIHGGGTKGRKDGESYWEKVGYLERENGLR